MFVLVVAVLWLLGASPPARAQGSSPDRCEPARGAVAVRASVTGADALTVSYTVVNSTRSPLIWLSVGSGGAQRTRLVVQQTPKVTSAPAGWMGTVVYPEETPYMHLWWESRDATAGLPVNAATGGFAIEVASPATVPPGFRGMDGNPVRPIDFGTLPFTAGGTGVQCWWGRVTRP